MAEELNDQERREAKLWQVAVGAGTDLANRVAYLEARVGELHQTIGDLRAANADLADRRARWAEEHEKRRDELEQFRDLLGAIWLYVNWHYVTKQLTTEQKNLWADAVDASGDPDDLGPKAERWWSELPCGHTVAEAQRSIRHELCDSESRPQCAVHPEGGIDGSSVNAGSVHPDAGAA